MEGNCIKKGRNNEEIYHDITLENLYEKNQYSFHFYTEFSQHLL